MKKDYIFERDYKLKCMEIYAILPEKERMDNNLQKDKLPKGKKYISFKHSSSNMYFGALYINEMNNIEVNFETLYNVAQTDQVKYEENISSVCEVLMEVKINKALLFVAVE